MKLKKKLIWIFSISGILLLGFIAFISQYAYIVPKNNYSILDQSGDIRIESYPKLKEVKFMYNTDLYIEFTRPINLELEKIIRKIYPLQKEFLRILGRNAEVYDLLEDGRFYIDIYIKDLKTNKTFIIKRDNIHIYYESVGIKLFSM